MNHFRKNQSLIEDPIRPAERKSGRHDSTGGQRIGRPVKSKSKKPLSLQRTASLCELIVTTPTLLKAPHGQKKRASNEKVGFTGTPRSSGLTCVLDNSFPESDNDSDRMLCDRSPRGHKRARTSPPKTRSGVSRARHEKKRLDRLRQYADRNQFQRKFAESLRSTFVPPGLFLCSMHRVCVDTVIGSVNEVDEDEAKASTAETHFQGSDDLGETPLEAGPSHEAEVAESIRKLRELEKDRPIWEALRKEREARERAEEQERLAKAERRREEEEQRQRQQCEAAERETRRAQQEAERLAREEETRQREIRQRRQRQRWESGPWTTHRALERYRMLSDEFDAAKFTSGQSITFHDIPWPVLHAPSRLTVEDVDWSAVETFFGTVKDHMRLQDYKEFIEKSHRRFHPDRWRARKIWVAVTDEVERGYLEVAANTVAQAITPIWRAVKEK